MRAEAESRGHLAIYTAPELCSESDARAGESGVHLRKQAGAEGCPSGQMLVKVTGRDPEGLCVGIKAWGQGCSAVAVAH